MNVTRTIALHSQCMQQTVNFEYLSKNILQPAFLNCSITYNCYCIFFFLMEMFQEAANNDHT